MPFATARDGVRVHYQVAGSGPPLVLLHGFGGNGDSYRESGYVDALASDLMVVLPDARGHGRSDRPEHEAAYSDESRASNVEAVLDDLELATAHVAGYSSGGEVALFVLRFAPERLRSALVGGIDPRGGASSEFFRRDFDELWSIMNRSGDRTDHEAAHRAEFHQNRLSGSAEAAMAATTVPLLCFAGEDDESEYAPLRETAAALGIEFVTLRGDHGSALSSVPTVAAMILDFIGRIELDSGH